MKNKVLALLLCLGMTVSLTACGGDAGSDESAAGGQDSPKLPEKPGKRRRSRQEAMILPGRS